MPCFIGIDPNVLDTIAKSGTGVYQADTLEELAELIDVDPATFTATIERYNEMCEKGVDEDFMKSSEYLIPVKNPPFYAFNEKWVFVCSIAGVHTNDKFQVLNADHEVIPGLFAAGNTVGRRFGYAYESSGMFCVYTLRQSMAPSKPTAYRPGMGLEASSSTSLRTLVMMPPSTTTTNASMRAM